MAGAITFNLILAVVPALLLVAGLSGFVLTARFGYPTPDVVQVLLAYLPALGGDVDITQSVGRVLEGIVAERTGFSVVGALILLWLSTRLVTTLRIVLREVFQRPEEKDRGLLRGKLFDFQVVLVGGVLILLNIGVTVGIRTLQVLGIEFLALEEVAAGFVRTGVALLLSFGSAWVLFFLLYRYLPARHIPFRTAAVGATFSAVAFELLKAGFAWYVTSVATYTTVYGNLAVVAVLFLWIYYGAAVFILGGHVARVYEERRETKMDAASRTTGGTQGGARVTSGTALLLALLLALPGGLQAQSFSPFAGNGENGGLLDPGQGVILGERAMARNLSLDRPLVDHDGPYVVVHLAENRVLVLDGPDVIWSAPSGTGHGLPLEGQGQSWVFTTPVGLFQVLRKEKDPVWLAPDWYYVQRDLAVPASSADRARIAGTLGTSAVFLGDGIAIHGTDRPELLLNPDPEARRVSHGCIRLTNEAARQLYHMVDVGTPVLIY